MSNNAFFTGRLAEDPEIKQTANSQVCRIRLIRNEYAGRSEDGASKERVVTLPITAWGHDAERLAKHARKGDQIGAHYRVENNVYTGGDGQPRYDYNFVLIDFEFGAPGPTKRAEMAAAQR